MLRPTTLVATRLRPTRTRSPTTTKSDPIRTCVGCRRTCEAAELLRVGLVDGRPHIGPGPGRGAWLCRATIEGCLDDAVKSRAFARAFRTRVDPGAVERFRDLIEEWARRGVTGVSR